VAFALTVTKGPGEGTEFPFEGNEAKLGRTADNDLVVKDSGASRSHCRVYLKGNKYVLEDLKSANGTKLNGAQLTGAKEIKAGDRIAIGDVEFTFSLPSRTETELPASDDDTVGPSDLENEDPNQTLLKPPREVKDVKDVERERRTTRKPPAVRHDTEGEIGTVAKGEKLQEDNTNSTMEVPVPPPRALAKVDDSTREVVRRTKPVDDSTRELGLRKGARPDPEVSQLTAADRAKKRREASKSTMGRIALQWSDLPLPARLVFGLLGIGLVVGSGAFFVSQVLPKNTGPKKIEPTELQANAPALRDSFGVGDDVTWSRPDMKLFNFALASPTQVVAVLHFSARDISKDEVSITTNGAEVGTVPPDTMEANREMEVVFPPNIVKPRENNQLVFDSLKNPPGNEPWRVSNIWIEIIPIPELSAEETAKLSRENIVKADKLFEMRDIGPDNLFKAWKTYREAWLLIESLPNKSLVQDVYVYARTRMRELRPLLDQKCNGLLVEYQKAVNARPPNLKLGTQTLKDIERYFPTREHPCFALSKSMLSDMEAW
jgi:pSer/pThr/pTyr-binding forkhead associated (FHA) protein